MMILLRYFPRQLRDLLLTRGAAMLVVGVVFSLPLWLAQTAIPEANAQAVLRQTLEGMTLFLTMIATYGIVGEDVRRGYYRFLFSKPISPIQYSVQAMVAAFLVFVIAQFLLIGVFAMVVEPVWPDGALRETAAAFVLLGSMIFALSRVTRMDWLIALTIFIFGNLVRVWYPPAESFLGKLLNVVFPPNHLLEPALFPPHAIDWSNVAWVAGYSVACIVIGLSLVRFIPLSSGR